MLCARPLLRVPRGLVRHPGMENRQELAHAGRQRDFRRVASRSQASYNPLRTGCYAPRHAYSGHADPDMGATTPTGPGAPQGPAGPINGGPPTRAAMRWRFNVPHSGRSSRQVRGHTGPLPGTLRKRASCSRQIGRARRVVSKSSSSAASRVLSQVRCASISVWRRRGALPSRFRSAVRMAMRSNAAPAGHGAPPSARRAGGVARDARRRPNAPRRGPRGHPSEPGAPWLWQHRGRDGDGPPPRADLPPPVPSRQPTGNSRGLRAP